MPRATPRPLPGAGLGSTPSSLGARLTYEAQRRTGRALRQRRERGSSVVFGLMHPPQRNAARPHRCPCLAPGSAALPLATQVTPASDRRASGLAPAAVCCRLRRAFAFFACPYHAPTPTQPATTVHHDRPNPHAQPQHQHQQQHPSFQHNSNNNTPVTTPATSCPVSLSDVHVPHVGPDWPRRPGSSPRLLGPYIPAVLKASSHQQTSQMGAGMGVGLDFRRKGRQGARGRASGLGC